MLNIKNPETHRKAKELAALTGKSMAKAVDEALEQVLKEFKRNQEEEVERRIQQTMEIAKEMHALIQKNDPGATSKSMQDELYDEHGLPV